MGWDFSGEIEGKPEVNLSDLVKVQQSKMLNLIQSLDQEIQWRPSMVPSFVNQLLTFPILVVGHSGNNRFYPILSQSGVVSKTEILQWNCFTFVKAKKGSYGERIDYLAGVVALSTR